MKSTALWVLRYLLVPVGFIWATGIIGGIISLENSEPRPDPYRTFSKDEIATLCINPDNLRTFGDSLVKDRQRHIKETGFYEPYLYFGDLKQFSMFEAVFQDSLNKTYEGRSKILTFNNIKNNLVGIRGNNWKRFENIEKIRADSVEVSMSITEAQHFWFPKVAEKDALRAKYPPVQLLPDFIIPLLFWFFGFYLKGLPFAFALFLIWRFRFKKEVDEEFRWEKREKPKFDTGFAPLSFLISLIFWPLILYIDIRNRLSDSLVKAEVLSRRKDMLSVFSKQDKKLLALGKQMSFREFRIHLDSLGMKRRHSFASALFVVLFFVSIQRVFSFPSHQLSGFQTTTHMVTSSGDADVGWNYSLLDHLDEYAILPSVGWTEKVLKFKNIFSSNAIKAIPGFVRLIEGVPKVSNQFSF